MRELVTRAVLFVADAERSGGDGVIHLDTSLLLALADEGESHRHPGLYL